MLNYPKNRDDYVFIDEEQVTDGHVHNFNKYDFKERCKISGISSLLYTLNQIWVWYIIMQTGEISLGTRLRKASFLLINY